MTEVENYREKKKYGCGVMVLYNGFRRRTFWSRRTASSSSISTTNGNNILKLPPSNSKRRRGGSIDAAFNDPAQISEQPPSLPTEKPVVKTQPNSKNVPPQYQSIVRKTPDAVSSQSSSSGSGGSAKVGMVGPARRGQKDMTISGELESMIPDNRANVDGVLVRASSSNMMVFGHLGNLRQPGNGNLNGGGYLNSNNVLDYLPKTASEMTMVTSATAMTGNVKGGNRNFVMGNVIRKSNDREIAKESTTVLCRALSTRLSPEELKAMGNEEYKKGKYAEALEFYDRAIAIDPDQASYRSNKSAALIGLGRLLEAVDECREAIRIEPSYSRAHYRLATLYLRLGEGEKARNHYRLAGSEASGGEMAQARALQTHLCKCQEARKLRDWHTVLKEAECAISAGANSAPQVLSMQAEALLKLHRHQEADITLSCATVFDADSSTRFFGPAVNAYHFLVRAQVDMAAGRFEDSVAAAQRAARLDSSNKEVGVVIRRARAVSVARSNGNELFKASRFTEACAAYGEGLEYDPLNSVLLCNRAACRSKLGQWEKAIEDCTSALTVRPSYSKARLRRADCNAKLERWEASIQDYEALIRETPGDEEVGRALFEAKVQLKKRRGEDVKDMKFGADVVVVTSNDRFRYIVTSPGMSVVLFCNKSSDVTKQILSFTQQLCKRYPSVNFLKVDIEDNPYVAKSEGVVSVPGFKIYKNGSKVRDIDGTNQDLLESSVKFFST
ncbi:inactive TPR repeat-containing thioredoxin TTL3-like [Magnolia sinica]|uniref:inactive TPR repeat-containing thioredoxin TTL3-like n=1 Tax=Magnolia sinica TaxID=86752 RepID=UPI00265AEC4F|nr:inactive TPR repeat-containing thioredoxin TTL3-like [Magnolia sinica]